VRSKALAALSALVFLAACGGDSTSAPPPPKPTITGTWGGVAFNQPTVLTLLETNGTVSGSGTISGTPVGTRALTVTGVFTNGTNFALTLSSGTAQPINYAGTYNPNGNPPQLIGTFNGSGFNGEAAILRKQ
jgi:hypothetical protein